MLGESYYHLAMTPRNDVLRTASELHVTVGRLIRRLRAENAFPIAQVSVLARLEREGPRTTSALASAELVRPQSMAQTIAELEANELVGRRPDPIDRRQTLIQITDTGMETLARERRRRQGWLALAITNTLTPEERTILAEAVPLLTRIAES